MKQVFFLRSKKWKFLGWLFLFGTITLSLPGCQPYSPPVSIEELRMVLCDSDINICDLDTVQAFKPGDPICVTWTEVNRKNGDPLSISVVDQNDQLVVNYKEDTYDSKASRECRIYSISEHLPPGQYTTHLVSTNQDLTDPVFWNILAVTPTPTNTPVPTSSSGCSSMPYLYYRGASIVGYDSQAYSQQGNARPTIDWLFNTGFNSITVLVNWYQDDLFSSEVKPVDGLTVPDKDLADLIRYAVEQKNMGVFVKPHIEPLNAPPGQIWRGNINTQDDDAWFSNYGAFLHHYADVAEEAGAKGLVIGTELAGMTETDSRIKAWTELIHQLRAEHPNLMLIYAAHDTEYLEQEGRKPLPDSFWQGLNYIAVTYYADLSESQTPSLEELKAAWIDSDKNRSDVEFFRQWSERVGKPILFAEIGYRSVDYAAINTWRTEGPNGIWLERPSIGAPIVKGPNQLQVASYNPEGQTNAYDAFLQSIQQESWMQGAFLWQFEVSAATQEIPGGKNSTDYTVYGKPAATLFREMFCGRVQPSDVFYEFNSPDIALFEDANIQAIQNTWLVQSSPNAQVDLKQVKDHAQGVGRSQTALQVTSVVPDEPDRYMQLVYSPPLGALNWQDYRCLRVWAKVTPADTNVNGGELSLGLVDTGSPDREYWQQSRWMPADDTWHEYAFPLVGITTTDNPYNEFNNFVIPAWEAPSLYQITNHSLDLKSIKSIYLKTLTTPEDARNGHTKLITTFDEIVLLEECPVLDVITKTSDFKSWEGESFDYTSLEELEKQWITVIPAPNPSLSGDEFQLSLLPREATDTQYLQILSDMPISVNPRYAQIQHWFEQPQDWSSFTELLLDIRSISTEDEKPYGCDFSIGLYEGVDDDKELWLNSRWFAFKGHSSWGTISIPLSAVSPDSHNDGWPLPPSSELPGFGVPAWWANNNHTGDGILDKSNITGFQIQVISTQESAKETGRTLCKLGIDNIRLR
ncbi:MAG: hypothetical protein L6461_17245 [Anaerolineae bacterium]|nr:hypothetical protein [Anaerolineae bacterium]